MIARLAVLAIEARGESTARPRERALAARWIAANLLAIAGVQVALRGQVPHGPSLFGLRAPGLLGALAAIAMVPALLDPTTLPRTWRIALRALGLPLLDRPAPEVLANGVSVARYCGVAEDVAFTRLVA